MNIPRSAAAALLALSFAFPAAGAPPPNVVVFLADDAGWGDLSFTGNRNLATPRIDSLGKQGASLDRFYVCPLCAPTRAEFLTGRYHSRGGVRGVSTGLERLDPGTTVADVFRAAGYATGAFGKWHNGSQWPYHPNARGFDEFTGFTSGHWGRYFDPPLEQKSRSVPTRGFIADVFTDHALDFIARHRDRPFLCYLPFNTPHSPFCVPDEYWNRFKDSPVNQRGPDGDREALDVTRCVLAMMENLDHNVGRVLDQLDQLGLTHNTLVVWFSDNGPNSRRWNGGLKGVKGSLDDGGTRSACLFRWPGKIKPGTRVTETAGAIDLLPTLAALAGIACHPPKPLDGQDLSPLLTGAADTWPDRMLFTHHNGRTCVRTSRHLLAASGELYDLLADPGQSRDLAAEQPTVAETLAKAVTAWNTEVLGTADQGGKGKRAMADDRPFPVGFREFPVTPLPARDGVPKGSIRRSASAPNDSYFTDWKNTADSLTWDIEVKTAGVYQVDLGYTCPAADAGATVEIEFRDERLRGKVTPAWDPPLLRDQDRVPRKGESFLKEFRPLRLGEMRLGTGRGKLTLRAIEIPGDSVMDLNQVTLTLLP